jgi:MerR family transcriptional regulator, light-induced transcriptional regulator
MLRLGTFDEAEAGAILGVAPQARAPVCPPSVLAEAFDDLPGRRPPGAPCAATVEQLCADLVAADPRRGIVHLERLMAGGASVETLFDSVIPKAAARLGELWVEDGLTFTAVTLGMARLTDAFRTLSPAFMRMRRPIRRGQRALFALAPGEQHALGVVLAADYFQRAGWAVQVELQADRDTIVRLAGSQPFQLVGVSAGSRRMLPAVGDLVTRLRGAVAPATRILVGGALAALEPDLAARVGADGGGTSAGTILESMECAA